eukprot:9601763-Karenia_brevis.AAC.1
MSADAFQALGEMMVMMTMTMMMMTMTMMMMLHSAETCGGTCGDYARLELVTVGSLCQTVKLT